MKFIIAGLGSIGRRHLRNLVALGEEDILLFRTHHSTLPDDELGSFPVATSLEDALAQRPDAVIVSNPTALHCQVAIPAAQRGCHLLLEKPVAAKIDEDVKVLQQVVSENNVKVLVGYQFRFHPVLEAIKRVLDTGALGRPYSFRVHWGEYLPGWHPWEDYRLSYAARKDLGGGVVGTLSHPLDYVRWLLGEISSLTAITGNVSDLELDVEDVAEIALTMSDGCVGSIHLDYFQRPPAHWMAVSCSKGHIFWDNASGEAVVENVEDAQQKRLLPPDGFTRNELFLAEMRHFIALVQGEVPSRCDLADGVRALEVRDAVHQSSRLGQTIQLS